MLRKLGNLGKSLLLEENGQTMLEYVVIVVFVLLVTVVAFRLVSPTVRRAIQRASTSIEQ
jgi:Flp pilus assembly pilin Flp